VKTGIAKLEKLTQSLNELKLFSKNETVDEVTTNNLKYLLLPALLANLHSRRTGSVETRKEVVTLCWVYNRDFLKRINEYEIVRVRLDPDEDEDDDAEERVRAISTNEGIEDMARIRHDKIARFQEKKRLESIQQELQKRMDEENVDDEIIRKYYLSLIKKWTVISFEELDSLKMEKECLKRIESSGGPTKVARPKKDSTFKPFILTRNDVAKKVFGLGYPAVPVMTVDEFVDQKEREGTWAFTQHKEVYENSLQNWAEDPDKKREEDETEDARKERLAEEENDNEIRRLRDWDEFKDDTKRGSGNTMNRS
jgi:immunoglobulin-binding protein 1